MTRLAVRRTDTGEYMQPRLYGSTTWGPNLQDARLFDRKGSASSAVHQATPYYKRVKGEPKIPFETVPVRVIPVDHHDTLQADSRKLEVLEAHGVDNWEWYGDAMRDLEGEEEA